MKTAKEIVKEIFKITNGSPYGCLGLDSNEATKVIKLLKQDCKQFKDACIEEIEKIDEQESYQVGNKIMAYTKHPEEIKKEATQILNKNHDKMK